MATENHIQHFTAADIEKYHKGLLSAKEMHDLEKAAMDDPFLADALEGYAVAGVQVEEDIADLKRRLAEKTGGARIIPMAAAPKNSFRILKAAIVIAFIAGAGLLIYQFGFNKKENEMAKAELKHPDAGRTDDTGRSVPSPSAVSSEQQPETNNSKTRDGIVKNEPVIGSDDRESKPVSGIKNNQGEGPSGVAKTKFDDITVNRSTETRPLAPPPAATTTTEKPEANKMADKVAEKKELAKEEDMVSKAKQNRQERDLSVLKDESKQPVTRSGGAPQQNNEPGYRNQNQVNQTTNIFRGRVTDGDNNGVPFANVTNVQDNNAGTYTDAKGYFNLTYPDSVLTVQVKSIGFESNNVQLKNSVPSNQVVLQDDRKTLSEVVLTNQKPNAAARKKDANLKLEEPEPADGWEKYDTYLTNNLAVPEDLKNKASGGSGDVQVSFDVNKNGEPSNFKVEKSLCSKCDREAIRLIKEGPKWKRNAKKGRTTVTIHF